MWQSRPDTCTASVHHSPLTVGRVQTRRECQGSRAATVIFTDIHGNQVSSDTEKRLEVKIDNNEKVEMGDSESHVGSDNFGFGWNQLRKGKKVIVSGDGVKAAVFTLQGASGVIPEFGTDGCISGFAAP